MSATRTTNQQMHVSEMLSALLDNRLTPGERLTVETHLAHCSDCRSELDSLQETVNLLRELPVVPVPRPFYINPSMLPASRGRLHLPVFLDRAWAYGALRMATSAVAMLLVVVVAADALLLTGSPSAPVYRPVDQDASAAVPLQAADLPTAAAEAAAGTVATAPASKQAATEPAAAPTTGAPAPAHVGTTPVVGIPDAFRGAGAGAIPLPQPTPETAIAAGQGSIGTASALPNTASSPTETATSVETTTQAPVAADSYGTAAEAVSSETGREVDSGDERGVPLRQAEVALATLAGILLTATAVVGIRQARGGATPPDAGSIKSQ